MLPFSRKFNSLPCIKNLRNAIVFPMCPGERLSTHAKIVIDLKPQHGKGLKKNTKMKKMFCFIKISTNSAFINWLLLFHGHCLAFCSFYTFQPIPILFDIRQVSLPFSMLIYLSISIGFFAFAERRSSEFLRTRI